MKKYKKIIITVLIVFSLLCNVVMYIAALNFEDKIDTLEQERYEWCNSFNQVSNLLEQVLVQYVDEDFVYEDYPDCELIKPNKKINGK